MPRKNPRFRDPKLERQQARRRACEDIITKGLLDAGLNPYAVIGYPRGRGRPLKQAHPFPSRAPEKGELDDLSAHRLKHQRVKVDGCQRCYSREYSYWQRHEDQRPTTEATAGFGSLNQWGMPLRLKVRKRPWVDIGWEKDWPELIKSDAQRLEERKKRRGEK